MDPVTTPRAGRREWTALTVLLLPLLLVSMDVSVLYFAAPFISRDLAPTGTQQLWIFDIYGFVLAGLLLTMGAIGDRIGRRRLLLIGAAAFGTASVLAAYADSAGTLIAVRALLGVGGATLMPSTLALVRTMFRDPGQRATAVSIWTGAMAGGIALGPVLSGLLLERFWWGSVFLINLPAMVLLLVLAPLLVPESRDPAPGRFDLVGAALSLAMVLPVVYGLKKLAADGLGLPQLLSVAAGLLVGAVFVRRMRGRRDPVVDPRLFRDRGFSGALVVNTLVMFAMLGFPLFTTQYLQSVLGLAPLTAALWSLLPAVLIGGGAALATALAARVPRTTVISGGFTVSAAGFAAATGLAVDSPLWLVLVFVTIANLGAVAAVTLISDLALTAVPPNRAGSASAVLETGQEFGGALGMAVLGLLGTAVYRAQATDPADTVWAGAPEAARETLAGALAAAGPGPAGEALVGAARAAFTSGLHLAAGAAALVMLLGAALAPVLLRRSAERPVPEPATTG